MAEDRRTTHSDTTESLAALAKTVEKIGWGLFLLWLGLTLLLGLDWPVFLVITGLITLSMQLLRRSWHLALEPFWIVFGVVSICAGIWEGLGSAFPLVPTALIIFGIAALLAGARQHHKGGT